MAQGWIKLHRQILECSIWVGFDDEPEEPFDKRSAWIDLLLRANHNDKEFVFNYSPITVGRGQLITSVRKLATRWGWSVKKTYNYLNLLVELGMITKESDNSKTLLTIVNYGVYQDIGNTKETVSDTVEKHNGNTEETQPTHKQEYKELKNEKNDKNKRFIAPTLDELKDYIWEKGYNVDAELFHSYYVSNGWKVGRNPMKDWKATLVQWNAREKKNKPTQKGTIDWDNV